MSFYFLYGGIYMAKEYKELADYRIYMTKSELHKAVNSLKGLISGVEIDDIVNIDETSELVNWLNLHRYLEHRSPFSEIIPLIDKALEDGRLEEEEVKDILWLCNKILEGEDFDRFYNRVTSSLQELEGILHGLLADNILTDTEIEKLSEWMDDHDFLKGTYPYDEVYSLLVSVKQDGVISPDEKNMLIAFFANFIDTKLSYNINEDEMKSLKEKYSIEGICAVSPEITLENKTFSFTGASHRANRNEIAEIITNKGGIFNNNVTKKTDYLIVGAAGNPCWAFACYGRKIEKAIKLRKEGLKLIIVHENDFWDELY
jgi:NAD-dependent DNA ligase